MGTLLFIFLVAIFAWALADRLTQQKKYMRTKDSMDDFGLF
jgi:hypothetical protein